MALMKAFACQLILFGLYKLFLEQVVEEHLVPDELKRNCLVGFVCLLCLGIQLYTDKPEDEDDAGAEENPKAKSDSRRETSEKISEMIKISPSCETIGSNASIRVTATKQQTTSLATASGKMTPNDKQVEDSRKSHAVPLTEAEKVSERLHPRIFSPSSSDLFDTAASSEENSYQQETTTIPVLNGFSMTNVSEESDEDAIEIDQFVTKEPAKEAEQLRTVEAEEIVPMKSEDGTEETEQLEKVEAEKIVAIIPGGETGKTEQLEKVEAEEIVAIEPEDVTEQLEKMEAEEVKAIQHKDVTDVVVQSECYRTNGENIQSTKGLNEIITPKTDELEPEMTNGRAEESFNGIANMSSNKIEEIQSKELEDENANVLFCPSPKPDQSTKDIAESPPSVQEMDSTNSTSTKMVNGVETLNTNNVKTSTLGKTTILSPPEKSTVSPRQKIASSGDVFAPPVTIDISFIYACH